jgi:23S rRNA (cytosine1962-C5)-methyltransferase
VVQLDLSAKFLSLARQTYALNGFPVRSQDFLAGDYFRQVARLKDAGALFDCVILDPPFFSVTPAGRVDLAAENARLINKLRPLVAHNGYLVAVNNALYVSGSDYLDALRELGSGGYLQLEEIIPVPLDVTGYPETVREPNYPADPAPFNHPTKIAVLRVQRKDQAGVG